jgi:hypothetical protein
MKLNELPAGSRFLDVDSIPVVMLPGGECIAFAAGKGVGVESRAYPNKAKAGEEGDVISRDEFARWLATGRNHFDR